MDRSIEIRVGIIVLAAILILILGLLWLTETQVRDAGYTFEVIFANASGLAEGDPVHVGGVRRGRVEGVALRANDVIVTLHLQSDTEIRRDAKIAISDQGLMGQKFVAIGIGQSPEVVQPGEIVNGSTSASVAEAMDQLTEVLASMKRVVAGFETVAGDSATLARLRSAVDRASLLADETSAMIRTARPGFESAIENLDASAVEVRKLVETRGEKLGRSIDRAETAMAQLDTTMTNLRSASNALHSITSRIEAGEGTLGKLHTDDAQLYDELRKTVKDLDALLLDMQANPRKYLNFSVF